MDWQNIVAVGHVQLYEEREAKRLAQEKKETEERKKVDYAWSKFYHAVNDILVDVADFLEPINPERAAVMPDWHETLTLQLPGAVPVAVHFRYKQEEWALSENAFRVAEVDTDRVYMDEGCGWYKDIVKEKMTNNQFRAGDMAVVLALACERGEEKATLELELAARNEESRERALATAAANDVKAAQEEKVIKAREEAVARFLSRDPVAAALLRAFMEMQIERHQWKSMLERANEITGEVEGRLERTANEAQARMERVAQQAEEARTRSRELEAEADGLKRQLARIGR